MKKVTGLGGLFFRSGNPKELVEWYRAHLGIDAAPWGGFAFQWREREQPEQVGYTVWSAFPQDTDYFGSGAHEFMMNFRVDDLMGSPRRSGPRGSRSWATYRPNPTVDSRGSWTPKAGKSSCGSRCPRPKTPSSGESRREVGIEHRHRRGPPRRAL